MRASGVFAFGVISLLMAGATPALATSPPSIDFELRPPSGTVLPPRPSLYLAGSPDMLLDVTSNNQLVPYVVVPTEEWGIVRVDIDLASGPLRIISDHVRGGGEYLVAAPMPHRLRLERETHVDEATELTIASDATMFRIDFDDGRHALRSNTGSVVLLDGSPGQVVAIFSDRTEQRLARPDGSVVFAPMPIPTPPPVPATPWLSYGLLALLGGLGLVLQRRVSSSTRP